MARATSTRHWEIFRQTKTSKFDKELNLEFVTRKVIENEFTPTAVLCLTSQVSMTKRGLMRSIWKDSVSVMGNKITSGKVFVRRCGYLMERKCNTKKLLPKMSSSVETRGGFWNAFKMPAAHQNDAVNLYMAVPSMIYNERMERERVTGGNRGYGTPEFDFVPGWDPMTGLGTKFELQKQCPFATHQGMESLFQLNKFDNNARCALPRELSASICVKPNGLEYTGELTDRSLAIFTSNNISIVARRKREL
ncbi:hypothetical protein ARMGADRAFT_1021893 [Armillaria gallica]|uniref:Uncharacterized protein n=1 Tax=Armillaria gallica TaxID=47427 RepID=A0A2H3EX60_ARMGA|nr:hypothetical protein ARMGADRAFT_1021893 [Armillaria gallica]